MIAEASNRRDQQSLNLRAQNQVNRARSVISGQQSEQTPGQKLFGAVNRVGIKLL